jgi:hypothetical protein
MVRLQALRCPQLIFPSKTWFFGIYLNFQLQKSLIINIHNFNEFDLSQEVKQIHHKNLHHERTCRTLRVHPKEIEKGPTPCKWDE